MNQLTPRKPSGAQPGNRNAVRLGPKVRAVIAHLLTNPDATNKEACAIVGCPEITFYRAKRSPHFAEHFRSLARDRIRTDIAAKALHRYEQLLNSQSDYVAADIAKDALSQAGVRDRLDNTQRSSGIGSITINIGGRPGEQVRIEAQDVVHDGTAQRAEDERTD